MAKSEKGMVVNPTAQRNPNAGRFSKLQLRLYALISVLVLTLALIAILEFVNRTLPDGAQTGYAPQLRVRDPPVLAARSSTGTAYFIPASSTVTMSLPTCSALPPSCACPTDGEIPNCNCSPDATATVCMCTVKLDPSCGCDPSSDPSCNCTSPYIRECVCPPDSKCNSCQCPGGGSFYEACDCPADPYAAGCIAYPEEPNCSQYSQSCGCSVFQVWTCGYGVTRSDCSNPTTTVGGLQPTVATIYPTTNTTTTISSTANITSVTSTTSVTPTVSTSVITSSDVPSLPTISSSQTTQAPFSRLGPLSNSSQPVDIPAVAAPPTTLVPAVAPLVVSPSAIGSSAPAPLVVSPSALGSPLPSLSTLSSPSVALSTSSSLSPLVVTPASTTSPSPVLAIIAPGIATSPLAPGVILLVSSSLVPATSGPAPSQVAQVTFLRTIPPPSASVITASAGSVFTIPAAILAANLAVTPTTPAASPLSAGAATLVAATASLVPATSPLAANPTVAGPGGTVVTLPPVAGSPPNPTASVLGASVPPAAGVPPSAGAPPSAGTSPAGALPSAGIPPSAGAPPSAGVPLSSIILLPSAGLAGSLAPAALWSSAVVATVNPSAKASGTAASGSPDPSTPPPTAASALEGATSVSAGGGGGGGGGGSTSTGSPIPTGATGPVTVAIYSWPVSKTVLGGYIPIILARLFHGGWKVVYGHLDQLATMDQLVVRDGASTPMLFGTGLALWYVWPAYIAVWSLSPFATELIYFDTNYGCANPSPDNPTNPCWPPIMTVNVWVGRVLQGLLALVAATVVVLIGLWFKKPSGSNGDPTSIAAVAAIMGHPDVKRDFKEFDAEMSTKELRERLKDKRYRLSTYQTEANTERYGIIPMSPESEEAQKSDSANRQSFVSSAVSRVNVIFTAATNWASNWKTFQMRSDMVFVLYLFAIFAATIIYLAHVNDMSVIHLFDGSTVGRRLLFAVLACVASSYWARLQRDAQTLAPYADLAYPNEAPPRPTILYRKRSLAITALYSLLRNRHFFAALTAFTAVLSEFLIVSLSGMPYRPGQLRSEFLFCGIFSLILLIIMLIMLLVVNMWRIFAVPHLPRKPDNVAAVMTYVCNSAMNKDFEGLERDIKARDRHIIELRKRYRYGLRRDADGKERWAVDEVGRAEGTEG